MTTKKDASGTPDYVGVVDSGPFPPIKRYDLGTRFYNSLSVPEIVETPDGKYVTHDDYLTVVKINDYLQARLVKQAAQMEAIEAERKARLWSYPFRVNADDCPPLPDCCNKGPRCGDPLCDYDGDRQARGEPVAYVVEAAWREGWAACRDAEYVGKEAEDDAYGSSRAKLIAVKLEDATTPQPAEPVTAPSDEEIVALQNAFDRGKWFGAHYGQSAARALSNRAAPQPQQQASEPKGTVYWLNASPTVAWVGRPPDDGEHIYTTPQPQQIPEGYRLQPISEFDAMMDTRTIPEGYKLVPIESTRLTPDEARHAARKAELMSGPSDTASPTQYAWAGAQALAAKIEAAPEPKQT